MWLHTLDHIQVTAPPDVEEEMRSFYSTVLGLPEVDKPTGLPAKGGVWYALGEIQLHVGIEKDARNYASRRHIGFRVHDLPAFREHLRSHNVTIIPDQPLLNGSDRFYLRDPGGNRVEIIALIPTKS
jgi:catechol 2,3-dioxygenase-like lactoylglutathione lyase family enzyme